jgi:hypothetical protein
LLSCLFLITYFYQIILGSILASFVQMDPVTVSIVLGAFLSLSKPSEDCFLEWYFGIYLES